MAAYLKIYKLKSGAFEVIQGDILYSLNITPPSLKKVAKIGANYVPAGQLIKRPAKAILFTTINLLNHENFTINTR